MILSGWISPTGEFFPCDPYNHALGEGPKVCGIDERAHKAGWISIGHGRCSCARGSQETFEDKKHPAVVRLRTLLYEHVVTGQFMIEYGWSLYCYVDAEKYAKYGTIPKKAEAA